MRLIARFVVSVCLFLCLVLGGLWWSSFRAPWKAQWEGAERLCEVRSAEGRVMVEWVTGWPGWDMLGISRSFEPDVATLEARWGVRWMRGRPTAMQFYSPRFDRYVVSGGGSYKFNQPWTPPEYRAWLVVVPYGWPVGVLATPVAVAAVVGLRGAWVRRRTARRRKAGLCAACGYDVRASDGRCPECGEAIGKGG